jgi:hypothetical protein
MGIFAGFVSILIETTIIAGTPRSGSLWEGSFKEIRATPDGRRSSYCYNILIERLWRSLKYELIYLSEFEDRKESGFQLALSLSSISFRFNLDSCVARRMFAGICPVAI